MLRPPLDPRRARKSSGIGLGERFVSAILGMVLGALVGLALTWLFGVYSQRLGPGQGPEGMAGLVAGSAMVFGLLGFVLGCHAGSLLGEFIAALFALEGAYDRPASSVHVPRWLAIAILVGVVVAVVAFLR